MVYLRTVCLLGGAALACATGSPSVSPPSTELVVVAPERGLFVDGTKVVVAGEIDGTSASALTVNGQAVRVDDDGTFSVEVEVSPGLHHLHTVLETAQGPVSDTRAVIAGELVDPEQRMPQTIRAELSVDGIAGLFSAAGRFLLTEVETNALDSQLSIGSGCLFAEGAVRDVHVGDTHVDARSVRGGVEVEIGLFDVFAELDVAYAVACAGGDSIARVDFDAYRFNATVALGTNRGRIQASADVTRSDLEGFEVQGTGIGIVDDLLTDADWVLMRVLTRAVESNLSRALERALIRFGTSAENLVIDDRPLTLRAYFEDLHLDDRGARVDVGTTIFADVGRRHGYLVTRNPAQDPGGDSGVRLRIADELFQQSLSAIWDAGVLDRVLLPEDVGAADVIDDLATIHTRALLPPVVRFPDTGQATISIGDLIVRLADSSGKTLYELAVNARFDVAMDVTDGQASARFSVADRSVDVLAIGVSPGASLDEDRVGALAAAILQIAATKVSQSLDVTAFTSMRGIAVESLAVGTDPGHLYLEGSLGAAE